MNIHEYVITEYEAIEQTLVELIISEWSFQWNKEAAVASDVH